MGQPDSTTPSSSRKRQLNIIYFVDSARTRSFNVPLGRLNVLLFLLAGMLTWSVASVGLMIWMARGSEDMATRLRQVLATVLDYETRYDAVYDVAYPSGDGRTEPAAVSAVDPASVKPSEPVVAAAAPKPVAQPKVAPAQASPSVAAAEPPAPAAAPAPKPAAAVTPAAPASEGGVVVGNPVLEAGPAALELRFDLTSKSTQERAEGYVWAVAEFQAVDGKKHFIGAPSAIQVKGDGEPEFPQRSAIFGIRRFKKKIFSFPLVKDMPGTFTAVRIGVMDRNGGNRTTYNVPVEIKIGKGGTSEESATPPPPPGGPKSG